MDIYLQNKSRGADKDSNWLPVPRPTPQAQIADNDLAFGRIVEAVSNSPYRCDTAIFVVQDDAAGGSIMSMDIGRPYL